jgi:hypothetical protein
MAVDAPKFTRFAPEPEPSASWGLRSIALTRSVNAALEDVDVAREAAGRIATLLDGSAPTRLVPASREARPLARALATVIGASIAADEEGLAGHVVVLDSVANTGVALGAAASNARLRGASTVSAISVVAQADAVEALSRMGVTLQALETI